MMRLKNLCLILFLFAGTLHSLATFYWSFGGELGLLTVGQWTLDLKSKYGSLVLFILFILGIFKLSATWMPLLLVYKTNKFLMFISYIGAIILILHGGLNAFVGWLKFLNLLPRQYIPSEIGQAFIWDPLFLIWGLSLLIFLNLNNNKRTINLKFNNFK